MSKSVCGREKRSIMKDFMGDWKLEFSKLVDYGEKIKETNPVSSRWLRVDRESMLRKTLFGYFYICLDALKK